MLDLSDGKLFSTEIETNLALLGKGFFAVRKDGVTTYTRLGQFERTADGRLTSPKGHVLQTEGGADLVLKPGPFEVLSDGSVTQVGEPVARLALVDALDPTAVRSVGPALFDIQEANLARSEGTIVRQGALEASNVSTGDEMLAIMSAVRRAETGQRMVVIYDEMMGRAISMLGQA